MKCNCKCKYRDLKSEIPVSSADLTIIKESLQRIIYSRDTYIEREPGESANDRNDRAIRTAALWYQKHLALATERRDCVKPRVLLLTNDEDNRKKAIEAGIMAFTGIVLM